MWKELLHGFRQIVYPNLCLWCQELHQDLEADFCPKCTREFVNQTSTSCPRCASTVSPDADVEGGCVRCRSVTFHFETATRLNEYQAPLRELILAMKHRQGDILAEAMATLWAGNIHTKLQSLNPTGVVAIPLHWSRRLRRGFNVSALLAAALSKRMRIRNFSHLIRRTRATPSQTTLTPTQRRENVKQAFAVRKRTSLAGHRLIIVDDVLTTGSTASETAKALKIAGASRVDVAVIAHR